MTSIETDFSCKCGNNDPEMFHDYCGLLGYEANICKKCGRLWDRDGDHEPDTFSMQFVTKDPTK